MSWFRDICQNTERKSISKFKNIPSKLNLIVQVFPKDSIHVFLTFQSLPLFFYISDISIYIELWKIVRTHLLLKTNVSVVKKITIKKINCYLIEIFGTYTSSCYISNKNDTTRPNNIDKLCKISLKHYCFGDTNANIKFQTKLN